MKLSKKHWLIKIAYGDEFFMRDKDEQLKIPKVITLCDLIRCICFKMPLFLLFMAIVGVIACPFFFMGWLGAKIYSWFLGLKPCVAIRKWWPNSILYVAISDFKNKTCTRIEIE